MSENLDERWSRWRDDRPPIRILHVDSAAAGRSSRAAIDRTTAHLRAEAELGAYIAEAQVADELDALRSTLGELLAMPADGIAFVSSAAAALRALLTSWPLPDGASVAVAPAEWGPNLAAFHAHGVTPVVVEADSAGRIDVAQLEHRLHRDPPTLVHVTQVAAHSGAVQPVAAIAAVARGAGVPVWVDAAQAIGHVDTASGADAVYATGRKWLCGPRGVGVLGIAAQWWPVLRLPPDVLADGARAPLRAFEADDAYVAGRVALAEAVRHFSALGPEHVWRRLARVGEAARATLATAPDWDVVDGSESAIVALRPAHGQDVATARERLLVEHAILTTASSVVRAPLEMTQPTLRVSPHVDCTADDLAALLVALEAISQT